MREQSVGVGQAAVRERELRVLDDRLLEELDRLVQAFFGALIEVVAALQVEIARGEVVGLAARARRADRLWTSGSSFSAIRLAIASWPATGSC